MEKKKLEKIIGMLEPNEFSIDQKTIQNYCTDWRGIYKGKSDLIILAGRPSMGKTAFNYISTECN